MYRSIIEIDKPADNDLIYKSLIVDMVSTERVDISISSGKTIKIEINARDITSLRAVVNTVLRQIKLIEDTTKIIDGENNDTGK